MGINIEFNTDDITPPELDALAALIAVLAGRHPGGKSLMEVAGLGTDADRPKAEAQPVRVVAPPPPRLSEAEGAQQNETDGAAEAALVPSAAEGLLAAEAARVAAAQPPEGVEVDKDGIPWDARIHASTKTKLKDGSWKLARGVATELVAEITAQLKAVMAAPVPAVVDPAAAFGGAPAEGPLPIAADNVVTGSEEPVADGASSDAPKPLFERMAEAAKAAAPPPPAEATPPAADGAADTASQSMTDFARVMRVVAAKQTAQTLSTDHVAQICQQLGLTGVRDLAARPDMIPAFEALLP